MNNVMWLKLTVAAFVFGMATGRTEAKARRIEKKCNFFQKRI